jgi:hypothetical protein
MSNHLRVVPFTIAQLNAYVTEHHRHHKPVQGHRFSLGLIDTDRTVTVGACSVGRPVARMVDQYMTAEVTRLVTDGTPNACSVLYGAAARACKAMGFSKIQTYILAEESGVSLRASGWKLEAEVSGGDWNHSKKNAGTRRTDQPQGAKQRWAKAL